MRSAHTLQGTEGVVTFHPAADFAQLGQDIGAARLVSSEQSNSSGVFGEAPILKIFRRPEPCINPELEAFRFLAEHGFRTGPAPPGWAGYPGGPLCATLG